MGEKLEITFKGGEVNDVVVFFTIVLFAKDYVVSDCVVDNPRFLGYETHASVYCYARSVLVCWEFHFAKQRVKKGRFTGTNISNYCNHLSFFNWEVKIQQMITIIRDKFLYIFSSFIPIKVTILNNDWMLILTNFITAVLNTW